MHGVGRSHAALVRRQSTVVAMQQGHAALAQPRSPSASWADVEITVVTVVHAASVTETTPAHQGIAGTWGCRVSMPQEGMGVGTVIIIPKPKVRAEHALLRDVSLGDTVAAESELV